MTDSERIRTGLAVSLFAHFLLLTWHYTPASLRPATSMYLDMDVESVVVDSREHAGLGIDSYAPQPPGPSDLADQRRQAFLKYLDAVDQAVHVRRLDVAGNQLLGVAVYSFIIRGDGTFTEPTLTAPSGNPALDAAAAQAIRAASGAVKRPPMLGGGPIPVVVHVKYQFDLR